MLHKYSGRSGVYVQKPRTELVSAVDPGALSFAMPKPPGFGIGCKANFGVGILAKGRTENFAAPDPNLNAPRVQNWVLRRLPILRLRIFSMSPSSRRRHFDGSSDGKKNDHGIFPGAFSA